MFEKCLAPAVEQTGFDLRMASQKAGLIDAVIEDEIRRCRFVIADLSDNNAGAYWEAGFAEGLGKPVIYVCVAKGKDGAPRVTHFDTNHRQTVTWDLSEPEETARTLKAVIRNTLLGEANQED
jgi:nucleoside 2-deoxyribosyltransferase